MFIIWLNRLLLRLKIQLRKLGLTTSICKICYKEEKTLFKFKICSKCFNKFQTLYQKFKINDVECLAIYEYNEAMKSLIYQFKGCSDYELKDVFLNRQLAYLKCKYWGYEIVPLPSSEEDNLKRGFNHIEAIVESLHLKIHHVLKKKFHFKQSALSKTERLKVKEKLKIVEGNNLKNKKILLVDDVYTTGSTLKAAIELIKKYKPRQVKALIIALNNCRK